MSTPRHPAGKAPVIVGVDGSDTSLSAVDLAARMATLSRRPLRIVHAFIWPYFHVPLGPPQGGPPYGGLRHQAERFVDEGVARARAAAPDTTVTGDVITGSAAAVLLDVARTAALVVIGDRGLGGFTGLLIGSVAVHLAQYSPCPVLVARGLADPAQPILLGVDGSPANDAAIGYAFEAAALHGVPLVALHAWKTPVSTGPGDMLPVVDDSAQTAQAEQRVLAEALAGWQDKYPDVTVERRLVRGSPRKSLIEASGQAQLVVVGSRGLGGFTGLLLGSVSHAVLYHATCPVAVVPDTRLAHPGSAAEAINVEVEQ
jgi:nucleotide-binding universal stress UspA family protein